MRQDKTVARILLILSADNVVLASPAVVRRSHLDVAKAASPPPESESFRSAPFDHSESSSAAANPIITTRTSGVNIITNALNLLYWISVVAQADRACPGSI